MWDVWLRSGITCFYVWWIFQSIYEPGKAISVSHFNSSEWNWSTIDSFEQCVEFWEICSTVSVWIQYRPVSVLYLYYELVGSRLIDNFNSFIFNADVFLQSLSLMIWNRIQWSEMSAFSIPQKKIATDTVIICKYIVYQGISGDPSWSIYHRNIRINIHHI